MLKKSFLMSKKHRALADKHTRTFPPETILEWAQMVKDWDEDHSKKDPYDEPEACEYSSFFNQPY